MSKANAAQKSSDTYLGRVVAGRYRLEARIGEGGMGVVYRAEQKTPIKRQVALKLLCQRCLPRTGKPDHQMQRSHASHPIS